MTSPVDKENDKEKVEIDKRAEMARLVEDLMSEAYYHGSELALYNYAEGSWKAAKKHQEKKEKIRAELMQKIKDLIANQREL